MVRADDPSLTPYAGLAVSGELARRVRVGRADRRRACGRAARAAGQGSPPRPVGGRAGGRRWRSASWSAGRSSITSRTSAPTAPAPRLRAVACTPSAPAALQNAKRFRRCHVQRVERAMARAGERLDRALGRDPGEPVTIDLDATQVTVYGRCKRGAARSRHGHMSYAPHVAFWAQRGRALTSELVGGNREKLSGAECARIARRAIGLLPAGHGPITVRIDSAYYAVELLERLRAERARFTVSVPRNQAMWKALGQIPEDAWTDALEMPGAQVAETTYTPAGWRHEPLRLIVRRVPFSAQKIADGSLTARRRKTIHPEQLALALDGQVASVFGYSFILTDLPADSATRLGRALPPPPRPDRRTPQGNQARPGAAPPALRRRARQPRLADGRAAGAQPHRPSAASCAPPPAPPARPPTTRRCGAPPTRCAGSSSTSPPASSAPPGARSCACPKASATPTSSRPPWTPSTRCRHPDPGPRPPTSTPQDRPARRPREPARSTTNHDRSPRCALDTPPPRAHVAADTQIGAPSTTTRAYSLK